MIIRELITLEKLVVFDNNYTDPLETASFFIKLEEFNQKVILNPFNTETTSTLLKKLAQK
jgi:hypothetical protein